MTLPEISEHQQHRGAEEEEISENDDDLDGDDIFGSTRTLTFRAKNKISMISNELRMREKRKRVLQMCLRKLERIKDSENNLRISVIIHNTYSRLTADIKADKRDKQRGQNRYQQQQQLYKESTQQKNQNSPKKVERKLDLENLEELCSIEENDICPPIVHDPILKNSEEIEQALSRKRKAEVEQALMSYHQLEKRLKSDAFHDVSTVVAAVEGHNDLNSMQCNNNNSNNNNNLLNGFQCGKAAALDSSNGIFQSLVVKSLET